MRTSDAPNQVVLKLFIVFPPRDTFFPQVLHVANIESSLTLKNFQIGEHFLAITIGHGSIVSTMLQCVCIVIAHAQCKYWLYQQA